VGEVLLTRQAGILVSESCFINIALQPLKYVISSTAINLLLSVLGVHVQT